VFQRDTRGVDVVGGIYQGPQIPPESGRRIYHGYMLGVVRDMSYGGGGDMTIFEQIAQESFEEEI
jgi:hypothetical protein